MTVRGTDLASQPSYRPGMDRRRFLLTSLAGALTAPRAAQAQAGTSPVRGGAFYGKTKPERCFATEDEARRAGCRRSKR